MVWGRCEKGERKKSWLVGRGHHRRRRARRRRKRYGDEKECRGGAFLRFLGGDAPWVKGKAPGCEFVWGRCKEEMVVTEEERREGGGGEGRGKGRVARRNLEQRVFV